MDPEPIILASRGRAPVGDEAQFPEPFDLFVAPLGYPETEG